MKKTKYKCSPYDICWGIILVLVGIVCCLYMTSCAPKKPTYNDNMLVAVDSEPFYIIYVDRETKVMYIDYNGKAITVMYNADGTVRTYEGDIE